MPQTATVRAEDVTRLIVPALNVLRGVELDLADHPGCPFRKQAHFAVTNLMILLELTAEANNGGSDGP